MSYKLKDLDNTINVEIVKSTDAKSVIIKAKTSTSKPEAFYGEFPMTKLKGSFSSEDYFTANCKPKLNKMPKGHEKIVSLGIIGRSTHPIMYALYLKPKGKEFGEVVYMSEDDYKSMIMYLSEAS